MFDYVLGFELYSVDVFSSLRRGSYEGSLYPPGPITSIASWLWIY